MNIKSEIFYHLFFTLIVNQSSIKVTKKVFFELEGKLHSISGRNSFPSINKETAQTAGLWPKEKKLFNKTTRMTESV